MRPQNPERLLSVVLVESILLRLSESFLDAELEVEKILPAPPRPTWEMVDAFSRTSARVNSSSKERTGLSAAE